MNCKNIRRCILKCLVINRTLLDVRGQYKVFKFRHRDALDTDSHTHTHAQTSTFGPPDTWLTRVCICNNPWLEKCWRGCGLKLGGQSLIELWPCHKKRRLSYTVAQWFRLTEDLDGPLAPCQTMYKLFNFILKLHLCS